MELEQRASGCSDKAVIDGIVDELQHRASPRAWKLLRRLAPDRSPVAGKQRSSVANARDRRAASKPRTDAEAKYLSLRTLFSAESEALARWGMTSLMPPEIRAAVFDMWRSALSARADAHPLGFGLADLKRDALRCGHSFRDD
jgi:hypothetical protein